MAEKPAALEHVVLDDDDFWSRTSETHLWTAPGLRDSHLSASIEPPTHLPNMTPSGWTCQALAGSCFPLFFRQMGIFQRREDFRVLFTFHDQIASKALFYA